MANTKKGRNYENQLCADVYRHTDGRLIAEPIGYSGNHIAPAPDIRIDDGTKIHAIELKRTGRDRISVGYNPDDLEKDDIHQLLTYAREYPRTVVPYVGVRFNNRQLLLTKLWLGAPNERAVVRSATNFTPTDVRLTKHDNLSIHQPSLDNWPSASAGDDVVYLLDTIGYTQSE
jgi:Holliday junction resolvase